MKKVYFLGICLLISGYLNAQNSKHEISGGVGIGTSIELVDIFSDLFSSALTAGGYSADNSSYSGGIYLGYKYLVQPKIGIGGSLIYEHSSSDIFVNQVRDGKEKTNYYTIAAEADYRYINKTNFTIYSGLGIGYTVFSEKYTPDSGEETNSDTGNINFQVTAIGAKFGNKIGGYAEAGFGYKGILAIGAFVRF